MDISVKAVVPALCADVLTFAANPLSAAPDRFAASTVPVTATALFASQNVVVDVDNREEVDLYTAAGFVKLEGHNSMTAYIPQLISGLD